MRSMMHSVRAMGLFLAMAMLCAAQGVRADVPTTPKEMAGFVGKLTGSIVAVHGKVGFVMTVEKAVAADESTVKDAAKLGGTDVWIGCAWLKGDSGAYEPESNSWEVWKNLKKDTKVKCDVKTTTDKDGKVSFALVKAPALNDGSPDTPAAPKAEVPTTPKEMDGFVGSLTGTIIAVHGKAGFVMTVEKAVIADESTVKDAAKLVGTDNWIGCTWLKGDSGAYEPESNSWDVWKYLKKDTRVKCTVKTNADKNGKVTFALVKAPKIVEPK